MPHVPVLVIIGYLFTILLHYTIFIFKYLLRVYDLSLSSLISVGKSTF